MSHPSLAQATIAFAEVDGPTMQFVLEKSDIDSLSESFPPEAIIKLSERMAMWVATRLANAWEDRQEPPSLIEVKVDVNVG